MKKAYKPTLVLTMAVSIAVTSCFWCGSPLGECIKCKGTGYYNDLSCAPCKGNGRLCPTHQGNWAG